MNLNIGKELAALRRMTVRELQSRYAEAFSEATNGRHKDWLVKRIIWRLQSLAEGDLSERARRRAAELANDADLRRKAPPSPARTPQSAVRTTTAKLPASRESRVPLPGSTIRRVYKGQTLDVNVLSAGQLSAQVFGFPPVQMGMNVPGCDNRQMALNIMHWLSGLTE